MIDSMTIGTWPDRDGQRDEAGASRRLQAEGCRGGQEAVPKLERLGAGDEGGKPENSSSRWREWPRWPYGQWMEPWPIKI
jgi:hypothetical protein